MTGFRSPQTWCRDKWHRWDPTASFVGGDRAVAVASRVISSMTFSHAKIDEGRHQALKKMHEVLACDQCVLLLASTVLPERLGRQLNLPDLCGLRIHRGGCFRGLGALVTR